MKKDKTCVLRQPIAFLYKARRQAFFKAKSLMKLEKANDAVTEEDRQELDDLIQKVGK